MLTGKGRKLMTTSQQPSLEERVSALERVVSQLLHQEPALRRFKDWRRAVGMFAGNELQKEIDAAGAAIRAADRQDAGA